MSTISDRMLEQWLQEIIQQSSSSPLDNIPPVNLRNISRDPTEQSPYGSSLNVPPFFQTNLRNIAPNVNNHTNHLPRPLRHPPRNHHQHEEETSSSSSSSIQFPEYDETMYRYHRNIADYQHTMLQMMECMESNQRRPIRQQNAILDNMIYPFNRNMQEYNSIMRESLDVLRELHQLPNATNVPTPRELPTHDYTPRPSAIPARQAPSPGPDAVRTTSSIQELYSLLPLMRYLHIPEGRFTEMRTPPPVHHIQPLPNNMRRLTPEQIQLSTRNYTYVAPTSEGGGVATVPPPVCPISLEEFRNGDSITQIQQCRHEFRTEYLNRWFQRDARCPICRCNLWDVIYPVIPPSSSNVPVPPLVESDASLSLMGSRPLRLRALSEPHIYRNNHRETHPPAIPLPEVPSLPSNTVSDSSSREIQHWLSTILSTRYPGFSNMDVDITYTVEYDVSMNPVSTQLL